MIFTSIKGITIPEGAVKQIADGAGRVLWAAKPSSIVPGLAIGYSGDYTDQADVVMADGKHYRLLTITGSGTLTLDQSVKADVWLCAGGNGGRKGGCHGGGGGKFVQSDGLQLAASTVCTVGAGASGTSSSSGGIGSTTTFGTLEAVQETGSYKSTNGASGGGKGGKGNNSTSNYKAGTGVGVSTVPFLDATFDPHSAGGGGGDYLDETDDEETNGGNGGSNGSAGSTSGGGTGGEKGGGNGGSPTSAGNAATFYGSGGGGGGYHKNSDGDIDSNSGGAGYQGVIYVRIPYEQ
jgi:hypothetical protein